MHREFRVPHVPPFKADPLADENMLDIVPREQNSNKRELWTSRGLREAASPGQRRCLRRVAVGHQARPQMHQAVGGTPMAGVLPLRAGLERVVDRLPKGPRSAQPGVCARDPLGLPGGSQPCPQAEPAGIQLLPPEPGRYSLGRPPICPTGPGSWGIPACGRPCGRAGGRKPAVRPARG